MLSEWIVDAALDHGLRVHGTSIPGVAQRTGSTTYYIGALTTPRAPRSRPFSLYPCRAPSTCSVAPEFLEVGTHDRGSASSRRCARPVDRLHPIALYSIHEKIATGRAIYPAGGSAARRRGAPRGACWPSTRLTLAREHGTETNAILLGALAASGAPADSQAAFRRGDRAQGRHAGGVQSSPASGSVSRWRRTRTTVVRPARSANGLGQAGPSGRRRPRAVDHAGEPAG